MDPLRSLEKLRQELEECNTKKERNNARIKEIDVETTRLLWEVDNCKQTVIEMKQAVTNPPRKALGEMAALIFKCENMRKLYVDSCINGMLAAFSRESLSLEMKASTSDSDYRRLMDEKSTLVQENQAMQYRSIKLTRELPEAMNAAQTALEKLKNKMSKGMNYATAQERINTGTEKQNANPGGSGQSLCSASS
jgi:hypothetical protein